MEQNPGFEAGNRSADDDTQQALSIDENGAMRDDAHDAPEALTGVSSAPSGRTAAIPDGAKRPQDHRKPAKRRITVKIGRASCRERVEMKDAAVASESKNQYHKQTEA